MTDNVDDVIDHLAAVRPGSQTHALRARRPVTREQAQKSWEALFAGADDVFPRAERLAVATFVAVLHAQPDIAVFYADRLRTEDGGEALLANVAAAAAGGGSSGPRGHYPPGPLSAEDQEGRPLSIAADVGAALGPRLSAALEHAHLLVFRPRDARPQHLAALVAAGWNTTQIVTLSQLVSFLAFQIRAVVGLKVLADA